MITNQVPGFQSPSRAPIPGFASLLAGFLLCFSSTVQAQDEVYVLSPDVNTERNEHESLSTGPASDWNHFDMGVPEIGLRSIMPNYDRDDPLNIELMNRFNKHLIPETVLASSGQIAAWHADDTLFAIEFDVLTNDPYDPPAANEQLGVKGIIEGFDTNQQYGELGFMYCYDEELYDDRIAYLESQMGYAPAQPTVWLGEMLQSGGSGFKAIRLSGLGNTIIGGLHSNGDLRIGGQSWYIPQALYRVGLLLIQPGAGHDLGPREVTTSRALPAPRHDAAWYQAQATANGTYFVGDLVVYNDGQGGLESQNGVALSGVVYATGEILIEGSGLTGTVTFVAQGAIDFPGSDCLLTAAEDGLLLWSTSTAAAEAIALDGSGCHLTGAVYAPGLEFRVGGSTNELKGRVRAKFVKITGSQNTFTDGTK